MTLRLPPAPGAVALRRAPAGGGVRADGPANTPPPLRDLGVVVGNKPGMSDEFTTTSPRSARTADLRPYGVHARTVSGPPTAVRDRNRPGGTGTPTASTARHGRPRTGRCPPGPLSQGG